jgi:hypothetical protein
MVECPNVANFLMDQLQLGILPLFFRFSEDALEQGIGANIGQEQEGIHQDHLLVPLPLLLLIARHLLLLAIGAARGGKGPLVVGGGGIDELGLVVKEETGRDKQCGVEKGLTNGQG